MEEITSDFDADLHVPPDKVPDRPPVETKVQELPFGDLTWENFERICLRIASLSERAEFVVRYGRKGQKQEGIDIFVRTSSGKYDVWQAKKYEAVSPSDIRGWIKKFTDGEWKDKAERLYLAIKAPIDDKKIQDEIETQHGLLKAKGISLFAYGGDKLSEILKDQPQIVDDFFGRAWAKKFFDEETIKKLGNRLDGGEFSRVRSQLAKFYTASFHMLDMNMRAIANDAGSEAPDILSRYVVPDLYVREKHSEAAVSPEAPASEPSATAPQTESGARREPKTSRKVNVQRRMTASVWLADGSQLAVVGDAGSGKSSLLRAIALDVMTNQRVFPALSKRWGGLLPLHLSFSRWSRLSAKKEAAVGLKEIVKETLQQSLTADLISLLDSVIDEKRIFILLDGLDEWSDEQAARTTLHTILTLATTHEIPMIVTGRPRGLDKIGSIPQHWKVSELSPLSRAHQKRLAEIWFKAALPAAEGTTASEAPVRQRVESFFRDLERDQNLAALAGNPLLFVGLIALSMRQIALPRNRVEAIKNLTEILIEKHPVRRATEAGDTKSRFNHIADPEIRRSALGRLAFHVRGTAGGGTIDIKDARKSIQEYLTGSDTYAYTVDQAQKAATEMVAVNAETVGILIERAPGEISFAHASFEEYLAAEHINTWPMDKAIAFAKNASGTALWRNVLVNWAALLSRPTEVATLIKAVEETKAANSEMDRAINCDILLAEIAFGPAVKQPATTKVLTDHAFSVIERGEWLPARRAVLKTALTSGLVGQTASVVDARIAKWAPRRGKYFNYAYDVLGSWKRAPDVEEVLFRGLFDEERHGQHSAAIALAKMCAGDASVANALHGIMRSTLDTSAAAAALEALIEGWPNDTVLPCLVDAAFASSDATLKLVGVSGRIKLARASDEDKERLIELLSERTDLEFWDKPRARYLLTTNWINDPKIIDAALSVASRGRTRATDFEREAAMHYLLRCDPNNALVANWVREQLKEKYPFSMSHDGAYEHIVPFALAHADIRQSAVDVLKSDFGRHFHHSLQGLILGLKGDDIRDHLLSIARSGEGMDRYWSILPLVEGWGRSDPEVAKLYDEIPAWTDDQLNNLSSLLPDIYQDKAACRARLLHMAPTVEHARLDFITSGLSKLGSSSDDNEAVDILLGRNGKGPPAYDLGGGFIIVYSRHPKVRELAIRAMRSHEPMLHAMAHVYENDDELRKELLQSLTPLPLTLRSDLVEFASIEMGTRESFRSLLGNYDLEHDSDLKIGTAIHYYRQLAREKPDDGVVDSLKVGLNVVGPDYQERRAAAFAGVLLLGHLNIFMPLKEFGDKLMHIRIGAGYGNESGSLASLLCEKWIELKAAFGDSLGARLGDFGSSEGQVWEYLAPHIQENSSVRPEFLAYCHSANGQIGLNSLRKFAEEQPSSERLLELCWRGFDRELLKGQKQDSPWATVKMRLEIAYLLKRHFGSRADVIDKVAKMLKGGHAPELVALILLDPQNAAMGDLRYTSSEIIEKFGDWMAAVHLSAFRDSAADFVKMVRAMLNREDQGIWLFQDILNRVVLERLQRDEAATAQLKECLGKDANHNEIASIPQYLLAAGSMDSETLALCKKLLHDEEKLPLPRTGYDAFADKILSVKRSLMEVLSPSITLN
ncbi:MAG: NACHT domain-containing protein [Proteobacteria bacterium]|nr:NACHT domain-containing protein [Pseudomonadota bacterium]